MAPQANRDSMPVHQATTEVGGNADEPHGRKPHE
jgi:hypothetical protein